MPTPIDIDVRLIDRNLIRFARRLRAAGIKLGTGQVIELMEALEAVGLGRQDDVRATMRAVVVQRPEQFPAFDAEFERFWRDLIRQSAPAAPKPLGKDEEAVGEADQLDESDSQETRESDDADPEEGEAVSAAMDMPLADVDDDVERDNTPENVIAVSDEEALRKKNFSQYTPEEIARARKLMARLNWRLGSRKTRRRERSLRGEFIDQRRMLRDSLKQGGVPVELRFRRRKEKMRPLVLICDISGSMDRYSRLLLQFVHSLETGMDSVEVFVFGTRLTRITRELRKRDVDQAITDVVNAVDDWSGGTRIGEAIRSFNYGWSRRVLRSNATVIVISDGWDRGDPQLLGEEMARLQRSCRRLIWLNPLLGATGYQPLTAGIRAARPFMDYFLPIHNLESIEALADLLGDMDDAPPLRRQQGAETFRKGVPANARVARRN